MLSRCLVLSVPSLVGESHKSGKWSSPHGGEVAGLRVFPTKSDVIFAWGTGFNLSPDHTGNLGEWVSFVGPSGLVF